MTNRSLTVDSDTALGLRPAVVKLIVSLNQRLRRRRRLESYAQRIAADGILDYSHDRQRTQTPDRIPGRVPQLPLQAQFTQSTAVRVDPQPVSSIWNSERNAAGFPIFSSWTMPGYFLN